MSSDGENPGLRCHARLANSRDRVNCFDDEVLFPTLRELKAVDS